MLIGKTNARFNLHGQPRNYSIEFLIWEIKSAATLQRAQKWVSFTSQRGPRYLSSRFPVALIPLHNNDGDF